MGSAVEIVAYDSNRGRLEREGNPALSDLLYNELGLPYLRLTMQEPRKLCQVWISARHAQQGDSRGNTEVWVAVNTTPAVIRLQGALKDMPRLAFNVTFTVKHYNPSSDPLIRVADWVKLQHEEVEVAVEVKLGSSKTCAGAPQEYIDLRRKELEAIAEQAATNLLSTIKRLQEKDSA